MADKKFVHVVDDEPAILQSMGWLLESEEFSVRTYESADAFLNHYDPQEQGCLICDIRMPKINGFELQEILRERQWYLPTIFLTGHGDIPMAVSALQGGAINFLSKPCSDDDLLAAIDQALSMTQEERDHMKELGYYKSCYDQLTPRQRAIVSLMMQGLLNKQIAMTLGITKKTVESHRKEVMTRMQANSLPELTKKIMWLKQVGYAQDA